METNIKPDINAHPIWYTCDNANATRTTYHAYKNSIRHNFICEEYIGSKALCGRGGISNDGDSCEPIEMFVPDDSISEFACKKCLEIYNKIISPK